jgi:hypothetical protein
VKLNRRFDKYGKPRAGLDNIQKKVDPISPRKISIPSIKEMDQHCRHRECLKFINPLEYPMAYIGTPYMYDKTYMACFLCEDRYGRLKAELSKDIQPYPMSEEKKKERKDKQENAMKKQFNFIEPKVTMLNDKNKKLHRR